ncbi:MAG: DUF4153 domain-containing protein [Anaerolineaceae bacterium]|nr:MAG: DUF4153 domain-containing protein [Anaerolineaceae bacterium]
MKNIDKLWTTLRGFTSTINRYPVTILLFLFSAIFTSYNINTNDLDNIVEILFALALGATLYMLLQMVYERFCHGMKTRLIFGGVALLGAVLYYLAVEFGVKSFGAEHALRTTVLLFILIIGFIWVPVIKSKLGFSESFMVIFKSFFMVVLYSGVLFLGISLIIMAIDMLIVNVASKAYAHVGSIIGFIYAPIHFLSLIPTYPRRDDEPTLQVDKAIKPSKFLEGLISYIIIPITAIFTVILLLYIIMNITGDFWKDNLMEPLLVTYSITVIIVYLLASVIDNKAADYFRKIFPKVLIPVVLFQTISSILKIGELGITSGRYYVIIFGIFATTSAIIFSLRPNHKSNVIAPILIALSLVSILPPVDAFTISKSNQIGRLTNVLEKNDMLKDGKIVPNAANLSEVDRQIIINSVRYLSRMDYLKDISWLKTYSVSYDFEKTFGFNQYGSDIDAEEPDLWRLYLAERTPIDVSDYDIFVVADLSGKDYSEPLKTVPWGVEGYTIEQEFKNGIGDILVKDGQQNELIRYSLDEIFNYFKDKDTIRNGEISMEEAEFVTENDNVILSIVVKSLNLEEGKNSKYQNINAYIMVKIK